MADKQMGCPHIDHVSSILLSLHRFRKSIVNTDRDSAWCAFNFMKPYNPQPQGIHIALKLVESEDVGGRTGEAGSLERQNFAIRMATASANLFRIVHRTITMFCGTKGYVTGSVALARMREYQKWRNELPRQLQIDQHVNAERPLDGESRLGNHFDDLRIPLIITLQ
jgi:hypothetical protein